MKLQICDQVTAGIGMANSVSENNDPARESQAIRDLRIKTRILRRALTTFTRLIFMREMVEDVMRIKLSDRMTGLIRGRDI